jgi:hypothetical protein
VITLVAFAWLVVLAVAPFALWHGVISAVIGSFQLNPSYLLSALTPWLLLVSGILFLIPVAASAGLTPDSRLYPRARRAYAVWGTVVYLLGLGLSVLVSTLWHSTH